MDEQICEVIVTGPDADWLAGFTRSLVEDRLAACGHTIAAVRSIYRWQGAVHDDAEAGSHCTLACRSCRASCSGRTAITPTMCRA